MPALDRTDILPNPQLNDLAAAALRDGQEDAWPLLQAQIALICRRICGGARNTADEVTQRTCVKILRARETGAGYRMGGNFRAWCSRVAANAQNDFYREAQTGVRTGSLDEQLDPPARMDCSGFYDDASPIGGEDLDAANALFSEFPEMAIQVFAVSWLWRLLPEGSWEKWLTDPRITIEPPWPPLNVIEQENPRELLLCLTAAAFGITRDSVRKNVERQRPFILKLSRARAILRYTE